MKITFQSRSQSPDAKIDTINLVANYRNHFNRVELLRYVCVANY